jgi:hypothetical protein
LLLANAEFLQIRRLMFATRDLSEPSPIDLSTHGTKQIDLGLASTATAGGAIFQNASDASCNDIKVDRWR